MLPIGVSDADGRPVLSLFRASICPGGNLRCRNPDCHKLECYDAA